MSVHRTLTTTATSVALSSAVGATARAAHHRPRLVRRCNMDGDPTDHPPHVRAPVTTSPAPVIRPARSLGGRLTPTWSLSGNVVTLRIAEEGSRFKRTDSVANLSHPQTSLVPRIGVKRGWAMARIQLMDTNRFGARSLAGDGAWCGFAPTIRRHHPCEGRRSRRPVRRLVRAASRGTRSRGTVTRTRSSLQSGSKCEPSTGRHSDECGLIESSPHRFIGRRLLQRRPVHSRVLAVAGTSTAQLLGEETRNFCAQQVPQIRSADSTSRTRPSASRSNSRAAMRRLVKRDATDSVSDSQHPRRPR